MRNDGVWLMYEFSVGLEVLSARVFMPSLALPKGKDATKIYQYSL